jgi:hypothetical protein
MPFSPTLPAPNTLPDRLLWVLLAGGTVDHPAFEELTGSWRLAAAAAELRALGWPVETIEIPAPTPEAPQRCIGRYHMAPAAIEAGRELLRNARGGA